MGEFHFDGHRLEEEHEHGKVIPPPPGYRMSTHFFVPEKLPASNL